MSTPDHSAGGQLAGYIYQLRRALIELLNANFGCKVELETLDDVITRRATGEVLSALQSKHSLEDTSYTIKSTDIWKTLRVWSHLIIAKLIEPSTTFKLMSTATVDASSSLSVLLPGKAKNSPDLLKLRNELDGVAKAAENKKLKASYTAWLNLTEAQKSQILSMATVQPAEPQLADIVSKLDEAIRRFAIRPERVALYRDRVLGWFDTLVDERLSTGGCSITYEELLNKVLELNETILPLDLPSTTGNDPTPALEEEQAKDPLYLRQLYLLEAKEVELLTAVQMFHRGRSQRQHWLDLKLTVGMRLNGYDQDLKARWAIVHARASREAAASPEKARDIGRTVYDTCMDYSGAGLGQRVFQHVSCGSYHMLANDPKLEVGWHPDFRTKLVGRSPTGGT